MQAVAPLTIGLHGGAVLNGSIPVGRVLTLEGTGKDEQIATACSGTLISRDLVLTANHCVSFYLQSDGSLRLPINTRMVVTFAREYERERSLTYDVTNIYHTVPNPNSRAYLRFLAGQSQERRGSNRQSLDRVDGEDIAILRLARSPVVAEGIRPAIVERLERTSPNGASLIAYGIYQYERPKGAPVRALSGVRRQGAVESLTPRMENSVFRTVRTKLPTRSPIVASSVLGPILPFGALGHALSVITETVIMSGRQAPLAGSDRGDSGGFFGTTNPEGNFIVEGVISSISANSRTMINGGQIPTHIRAIDRNVVSWIEGAKTYYEKGNLPFSKSQPLSDLATLPLSDFTSLMIPPWVYNQTKSVAEHIQRFGGDMRDVQIENIDSPQFGDGPTGPEPIGNIHGVNIKHLGRWNSEAFGLTFFIAFRNRERRDRFADAVNLNAPESGLPRCWLDEVAAGPIAVFLGSGPQIVFASTSPVTIALNEHQTIAFEDGGTACDAVENLY